MTHLTGPRPRVVKRLANEITGTILASKGVSISESVAACHAVVQDFTKRLLKASGLEKDCDSCGRAKRRR